MRLFVFALMSVFALGRAHAQTENIEVRVSIVEADCSNQAQRESVAVSRLSAVAKHLSYRMLQATPTFQTQFRACIEDRVKRIFDRADAIGSRHLLEARSPESLAKEKNCAEQREGNRRGTFSNLHAMAPYTALMMAFSNLESTRTSTCFDFSLLGKVRGD